MEMNEVGVYCPGLNCKRKEHCKKHVNIGAITTIRDFSSIAKGINDDGVVIGFEASCGIYSNPPYAEYESIYARETSYGISNFSPYETLEIHGCKKIVLIGDKVEIEATIPIDAINEIREIVINGNRFVREDLLNG